MDNSTNIKTIYSIFLLIFCLTSPMDSPMSRRNTTTPSRMTSIATTRSMGIQRGDVTHHHDQSILPVSLRVKKIRNRTIVVLIPEDDLDDAMCD
jgi:hypothetical protein